MFTVTQCPQSKQLDKQQHAIEASKSSPDGTQHWFVGYIGAQLLDCVCHGQNYIHC